MAGDWRVTVRRRGAVEKGRHPTLHAAVAAIEARLDELAAGTPPGGERFLGREFPGESLVAARGEIRQGGWGAVRRGGIDLHADRSTTAWTGLVRRRVVDPRPGETAYEAVCRVLAADGRAGVG